MQPISEAETVLQFVNGVILLVLIAGQFEILTAAVNRSHSLPVRSNLLRHIRHMHDGLMVLFPPLLVGWVGFYSPGVLVGGSWNSLSPLWTAWLTACGLGCISLVICTVRWQLRPRPACFVGETARILDVARAHDGDVTGHGAYQFLTRVPGNEILQAEFIEKTYDLPMALPELRLLHLTDLHFTGIPSLSYYESVVDEAGRDEYDLVVFTGDLIDDPNLMDWIPKTLGRLKGRLGCYYILGNHDWNNGEDLARPILQSCGWTDVAGKVVTVPGTSDLLVIGGTEKPWMGQHPDYANTAPGATRILLSHTPDNLAWARANDVQLMLSGHNHGGQVRLPVVGPVYSPSWFGVRHSGGDYYVEPTLLHVSRGLGALHPLRLNCRPEVATLVFRDRAP